MRMYVIARQKGGTANISWQTTEQVNDAVKRGLPAERPVRRLISPQPLTHSL